MEVSANEIEFPVSTQAEDVLRWALEKFHPNIALACSFQHNVLVHMAVNIQPDVRVFAIDTGRLPEETFICATELEKRYGIKIEWFFPNTEAVQELINQKGVFSFYQSIEARRECCSLRKVEPLTRALSGLQAWITGVRHEQNITRQNVRTIERDDQHGGILKICPLAEWSEERIKDYVAEHKVPYNPLFDRGYSSVGCACCTRAIKPGDHPRSGRWWWEEPENKECGLHVPNWVI